jgi:hypothetical protein
VSEIEVTLGEVSRGLARMEEALRVVAGQVRDTAVAIAELRVELREHRDAQTAAAPSPGATQPTTGEPKNGPPHLLAMVA